MSDKSKAKILRELTNSPEQQARLAQHMVNVVARSFLVEKSRTRIVTSKMQDGVTREETKSRTNILYDYFCAMRGDLGFSFQKALDHLDIALRQHLDNGSWEPPAAERGWGATTETLQ